MLQYLQPFFDLLYPNLCVCCGRSLVKGEEGICTACLAQIPRTNLHRVPDNELEQRFWGKVPIVHGTAFFRFDKGSLFRQVLHRLKYKGDKEIGRTMGRVAAADLLADGAFEDIDIIVPVPLHPKKQHKRGYNQSEWIAMGLSDVLGVPYDTKHLLRIRENTTQTKKNVYERFLNSQGIFGVENPAFLADKHVLLVDDVLTTGATLEACAKALQDAQPTVRVSVFTLAVV